MAHDKAFPGLRSILRNGLFLTGTNWAEALLRAVYVLVIARFLGPSDYGLWSYVMAAYMLGVSATVLGMDILIAARLGRNRESAIPLIDTSLALRLALLSLVAVVLGTFALASSGDKQVALALAIAVFAVFGRGLALWVRPIFVGLDRSGMVLRITLASRLGEVALGIALLFWTRNILVLVALHAASWLVEATIAYVCAKRLAGFTGPRFHPGETGPLIRAGLPIGVATLCVAAVTATPVLLAGLFGAQLGAIGQLGIAMQFSALAVMAIQGFLGAATPVLSRAIAREDKRLPHYGLLVALVVVAGFGALAVLARHFGEPLITTLLGEPYRVAASLLPLAFIVGGLGMVANGYWQQQVLRERHRFSVPAGIVAVVLTIVLAGPLWNERGLEGLLLAAAVGWLARAIVLVFGALQKPT